MYIIALNVVSPLIQILLYAFFYALWQDNLDNYSFEEVQCITKIKGFPTGAIISIYIVLFTWFLLYKKNSPDIFKEKRQRMERLSQYMKPVNESLSSSSSSSPPPSTSTSTSTSTSKACILHFHAGRGKFLDIIADIFSRSCHNNYEIIALECFETKHYPESDYWLIQNARIMGIADHIKPLFCDFKNFNIIPSNSMDVILHGFDNAGSRNFLMGLKEDVVSIYRMLKPGGTVLFFGQIGDDYRKQCEDAGFVDYKVAEDVTFMMVFKLSVVVMKKPHRASIVPSSIEDGFNADNVRQSTMRKSVVNMQSDANKVTTLEYLFQPGKAYRCIEILCVVYIVFFILYAVFCVETYEALSVPTDVPYNYYVSTQFVQNLYVIPYSFVFLYQQLQDAALGDDTTSSDQNAAVKRVLIRFRVFMIGLILSLTVYNFFSYILSLVIYLICVDKLGKSPNYANTISIIVTLVLIAIIVRLKGPVYAAIVKLYRRIEPHNNDDDTDEVGGTIWHFYSIATE